MPICIICNEQINNMMIMTIVIADSGTSTCSVIIATYSTIEFLLDALCFASTYVGIMSHAITRITCAHVVIALCTYAYELRTVSMKANIVVQVLSYVPIYLPGAITNDRWMSLFFFLNVIYTISELKKIIILNLLHSVCSHIYKAANKSE